MTVTTSNSQAAYTGDGSSTAFPFPYYFLLATDIKVYVGGVLQTSGYTVAGAGVSTGGSVNFTTAPAIGAAIILLRNPDVLQNTKLPPNDPFPSSAVEMALDKLTMLCQLFTTQLQNALILPLYETISGAIANVATRASKLLAFDVNGNITYVPLPASVGAGNLTDELGLDGNPGFKAGTDFTSGVTTALTLSQAYGAKSNISVYFDAAFQGADQYSLNGKILTFTSAIPVGVQKVFVKGGTSLSVFAPALGSVVDASINPASLVYSRTHDLLFITDGGLVLADGAKDDAAGMLTVLTNAAGRKVFYPARTYYLGSDVNAPAGSRAWFQTGVTFTGPGKLKNVLVEYERGRATALAASKMQIDWLWERPNTGFAVEDIATIWTAKTRAIAAFSYTFDSTDGGAGSPVTTSFNYAVNNGTPGDVCAGIDVGVVASNSGSKTAFGRNIIANAAVGTSNVKLVGLEIDIEPSAGVTSSGTGAGMFINGFNGTNLGAVLQIGGISGASFNNGIVFGAVTGSMLAMQAGNTCTSFMDTTQGGFTGQAINLGNQHSITYRGPSNSVAMTQSADTGGNIQCGLGVAGGGIYVNAANTVEGNTLFVLRDSSAVEAVRVSIARGSAANAAACTMRINGQSVTSRSINAGGTINASGADYAEYERKRDDCAEFAKGQIVGFDKDGLLTHLFSQAVSFGIKSTAPNMVGGDTWGADAGPEPKAPEAPAEPGPQPVKFDTVHYEKFKDQIEAEYARAMGEWEASVEAYQTAKAAYDIEKAAYDAAYLAWQTALEAARAKVDRIAYCGKVPLNVLGAAQGQYVVPVAVGADSIDGLLVNEADITFAQYRSAVGQVRRILEDGRAEVVVKVI